MQKIRFITLAIGLLSTTVIAFELTMIQVFSFMQWYHFAFMIITIALLGFGAAGTILTIRENWLLKRYTQVLPLLFFSSGLFMSLTIILINLPIFRFDTYLLFNDYWQVIKLLLTCVIVFIPFFVAALAIGLTFDKMIGRIGDLYFANMVGSGLGGVLFLTLIWFFFPQQIPGILGLFSIAGGWLLCKRSTFKWIQSFGLAITVFAALICWSPPHLASSQFKAISKTLLLPEAEIFMEENSPFGIVQAVRSPYLRYAPGLSLNYQDQIDVSEVLFLNGDWFGAIVPFDSNKTPLLDHTTSGLAYYVNNHGQILLLDAGTGEGIGQAVYHHPEKIIAQESNHTVVDLLYKELAAASDSLFYQPSVTVVKQDARAYLAKDTSAFSLIVLPMVNMFGGTSGLQAIQEKYLLTKNAIHHMFDRLQPDGMITSTTWLDYPSRDPLKLLATFTEVLYEKDLKPIKHYLIAIKGWGTMTFLLKKSPFTKKEIERTRAFCRLNLFDPVILSDLKPGEVDQYNQSQDTLFQTYIDTILSSNRSHLYKNYDFNIKPATDDHPYFHQNLLWKSFPKLIELYSWQGLGFIEIGYFIVYLTFGQITLLAMLLIIIPLFLKKIAANSIRWIILYFGGIGIGYLFIEIVLIQQYILYVGHATYASLAVISFLLIASGLGSYYSSRFSIEGIALKKFPLVIVSTLLVYAFILTPILQYTIGVNMLIKVGILIILTGPLGFVMGIPFPLGLSYLNQKMNGSVPWAWGINGYFSVISSSLATIIAIEFGFSWLFILGSLAYLVPIISCWVYLK